MAANSDSRFDLVRASTEAATSFVDAYYSTLANSRDNISQFYVQHQPSGDGSLIPDILWNGNSYPDGPSFQKLFTDEMPSHLHFDVHAVDCQVLNPKYSTDPKVSAHKNFSMIVMTSGHLRLEDRRTGPLKDFSETFVLVPGVSGNRKRDWLIQLQNFRYVVHHQPSENAVTMDVE